jgi:hypothetical protein
VIARQELASFQLSAMATAVLAFVVVPGEEEGVRNLAPETVRDVHVSDEPDDRRERDRVALGAEASCIVRLEYLGLSIEDESDGTPSRDNRQRLEGSVQRQTTQGESSP